MNKNTRKINVLITTIGCNTSISVAKALRLSKLHKYKIIGADLRDQCESAGSIFCDKHYQAPVIESESYIESLIDICKKEKVKFFMPVIDKDCERVSKYKDAFKSKGIAVCSSPYGTICICNDKYKTYTFLKEKGFQVPRAYLKEEVLRSDFNMPYPLFVKPRKGISSVDCYKVRNREELNLFLQRIEESIVQECLEGQQCVIDVINDTNGRNLVAIPRQEYDSRAGIGTKAKVVKDNSLIEYARQISEALNIQGTANIEVFKHKNNISLIEVNSRFSAGLVLSVLSGVNIPEIMIDVFSGKEIALQRLKWQEGLYMTRYWQEVYSKNNKVLKHITYL